MSRYCVPPKEYYSQSASRIAHNILIYILYIYIYKKVYIFLTTYIGGRGVVKKIYKIFTTKKVIIFTRAHLLRRKLRRSHQK